MTRSIPYKGEQGVLFRRSRTGKLRAAVPAIMILALNAGFAWYCVYLTPTIVKRYWLTCDKEYLYPWPFLLAAGGLLLYLLYLSVKDIRKEFILLRGGFIARDLFSSRFIRWGDVDDIISVVNVINGIKQKPYYEIRLFKSRKKVKFDITISCYEELAACIKAHSNQFGPILEYKEKHTG